MNLDTILNRLRDLSDPEAVLRKEKKFGVVANNAWGVYQKDLRELARQIPKDNQLAIDLFDTDIYEARVLCSKVFRPKDLTEELMEKWVVTFENWEICDSFSMALFARSPLAIPKALEWVNREPEFEKRAGFAIMAAYTMADKKADNEIFITFLNEIEKAVEDNRPYVKKAVNWALRNIGKRNQDLNALAIQRAHRILLVDHPAARWIANDAIKELEKEGVRMSDYPRAIYRPA
ncbi:DNA alkylation repair protein [bacterium SCSIO 12741]|nr:DNA alkylation repair protein [bacterium SCSIO 12741]